MVGAGTDVCPGDVGVHDILPVAQHETGGESGQNDTMSMPWATAASRMEARSRTARQAAA